MVEGRQNTSMAFTNARYLQHLHFMSTWVRWGKPDFLVLEKRFFKAINANLGLLGATVHIPYTEAVYRATVEGRSAKDKIHIHSPYSSLRVQFDTNEVEYVSPWEIVIENNGSNRSGLFKRERS